MDSQVGVHHPVLLQLHHGAVGHPGLDAEVVADGLAVHLGAGDQTGEDLAVGVGAVPALLQPAARHAAVQGGQVVLGEDLVADGVLLQATVDAQGHQWVPGGVAAAAGDRRRVGGRGARLRLSARWGAAGLLLLRSPGGLGWWPLHPLSTTWPPMFVQFGLHWV